jgi:predicted metal-dependent phosphoesterase TrpH
MTRGASIALLVVAFVAGTAADRAPARPPIVLGGYRVLAADFHTHSSTWSDGTLTPFGLVLEAERQGLDVIAVTGHNEVIDGKAGRWFAERFGGPIVLTGQEIVTHWHHVIAVGIDRVVDWRLSVDDEIDDVHRQGGVAIAAHPVRSFSPGFDDAAVARLDGAEICSPMIYDHPDAQSGLEAFAARGSMAAIGSSDFHGFSRMGICRTFVFARDASPAAVLDALRGHRTVVYGLGGKAYGDPALIALAETRPDLRESATSDAPVGWLDWISRVCGVAGLAGLVRREAKNQLARTTA